MSHRVPQHLNRVTSKPVAQGRFSVGLFSLGLAGLLAVLWLALVTSPVGAQQPSFTQSPDRIMVFDILRGDSKIGEETIEIKTDGNRSEVKVNTNVKVKIAFITAFTFSHQRTEIWEDGVFVSSSGQTDDDGTPYTIVATRDASGIKQLVNGTEINLPENVFPAELWLQDSFDHSDLFSLVKGERYDIKTENMGEEVVQTPESGDIPTVKLRVSGGLTRDLWFDSDGLLVRMHFKQQDSEITYLRH